MSINSLPLELLTVILRLATEPSVAELAPTLPMHIEDSRAATLPVMHITQVCRLWRNVALKDPMLWTRIDSLHQARMDAFLERSQSVPVSLRLQVQESAEFANVVDSLPAARLRRLDLELNFLPRDIAPLTRLDAPILECLTISSRTILSDEQVPIVGNPPLLQRTQLLSGKAENLKALALQTTITWLPTNHFPNLTHLHLSISPHQDPELRVYDIMPLFSNIPRVEFVHIAGMMYSTPPEPDVALAVALPRLRFISLISWAYVRVIKFLAQVELPHSCWVHLQDIPIDPDSEGYPAPLPPVAPLNHTTHLELASSPYNILLVSEGASSGFWIEAHIDDGSATWDDWLSDLDAMMPLANITSLQVKFRPEHTFWPAVLRHMSQLIRLDVVLEASLGDHWPFGMLCDLLAQEPIPVPDLRELRLEVDELVSQNSILLVKELQVMLRNRSRQGHRLHHLAVQLRNTSGSGSGAQAQLGENLATAIAEFVHSLNVINPSEPRLCEFRMRDVWNIEGAELYWKPELAHRPTYTVPGM